MRQVCYGILERKFEEIVSTAGRNTFIRLYARILAGG